MSDVETTSDCSTVYLEGRLPVTPPSRMVADAGPSVDGVHVVTLQRRDAPSPPPPDYMSPYRMQELAMHCAMSPSYTSSPNNPNSGAFASPVKAAAASLRRPASRSVGSNIDSLYNRYQQEDGVLKSTKRKDFYCATIWFPFFVKEYYSHISSFRQSLLSVLVYSYFVFVVLATNMLTLLVLFEIGSDYQYREQTTLKMTANVITSMLFVLNLLSEFRLSMEPLIFWWKVLKFGNWEFKLQKNDDTSIELLEVRAPKWNSMVRLVIVGGTQIISSMVLLVSGLLSIYSSPGFSDLVQDCLALIWISQIDEIVFQYLFLNNHYFKNLWRDEIFEETVYIYRDQTIQRRATSLCQIVVKNLATSLLGVAMGVIVCVVVIHHLWGRFSGFGQVVSNTISPT